MIRDGWSYYKSVKDTVLQRFIFVQGDNTQQKSHSKFDFTSQDVTKSACINPVNKSNLMERAKSSGN